MTQQKKLAEIAGSELVLQDVLGLAEAALGARPHDTGEWDSILTWLWILLGEKISIYKY